MFSSSLAGRHALASPKANSCPKLVEDSLSSLFWSDVALGRLGLQPWGPSLPASTACEEQNPQPTSSPRESPKGALALAGVLGTRRGLALSCGEGPLLAHRCRQQPCKNQASVGCPSRIRSLRRLLRLGTHFLSHPNDLASWPPWRSRGRAASRGLLGLRSTSLRISPSPPAQPEALKPPPLRGKAQLHGERLSALWRGRGGASRALSTQPAGTHSSWH